MRIGEMAEAVGISEYTLRYYENEGLLRVRRDDAGRRRYDENDVAWVQFIRRLKDTGMPLKDIREYSRLRYEGDATMPARLKMLEKHREYVLEQFGRQDCHLQGFADGGIFDARLASAVN